MADIVIAGYLGFANGGDEALLSAVLSELRRRLPGKTVTVLSMRPRETEAHYGVRACHRYNMAAVVLEIRAARVLVFGGGSLIQDATSRRSLWYYLSLLKIAQKHGVRTMLFANGIGPLIRESSRRRAAEVLSRVDAITLRDRDSAELLKKLGVPSDRVTVTADTAFLLSGMAGGKSTAPEELPEGARYAVISVRKCHGCGGIRAGENSILRLCRYLSEECGIAPLLMPMQYPRDMREIDRIVKRADVPVFVRRGSFSAADMASVLGGADVVVGMRYHMLVFAAKAGVPPVGISCDPKVETFCREMGVPSVPVTKGGVGGIDAESLCRAVRNVLADRDAIAARVRTESERMAVRAAETVEVLAGMFE